MLGCVILGFFLHPVSHIDPVYVAVPGAIMIFTLNNPADVEEAMLVRYPFPLFLSSADSGT
jgi:Na+/H+ antiporter NhaD/arsenite permease-like protein